jgi:CRP-like cAMP-binding protein
MLPNNNQNDLQGSPDLKKVFCLKTFFSESDHHLEKTFKKGEFIYNPGDSSEDIFFLLEGKVKVGSFSSTAKEVTKSILGDGEIFGELALIEEGNRRDFAQALEKSTICIIKKSSLKILMRQDNELGMYMMRLMGNRMLEMEQRLESLVFKDSRTRIIEFLYNLGQKKGQRVGFEVVIRSFGTHQEIANLTATSRQTVTTVLNDLRNRNLLTFNRRRLLIRDMDMLEKEISGS